jgi:hypothetical protein
VETRDSAPLQRFYNVAMTLRDAGAAGPLFLTLQRPELSRFTAALQRGVAVRTKAGRSVFGFLTEELPLAPEYVRQRITTVFLDGQVVDVVEDAMLREGSLLALSAAMPGLVGATLRRSGPYAAMRAEITRPVERDLRESAAAAVVVRVKLFNLLLGEIGPVLLEHGVLLERDAVETLGGEARAALAGRADGLVELQVRFG